MFERKFSRKKAQDLSMEAFSQDFLFLHSNPTPTRRKFFKIKNIYVVVG